MIPYSKAQELLGRDLAAEDRSVRGTLVTGLNDADVALLDVFEGDVRFSDVAMHAIDVLKYDA